MDSSYSRSYDNLFADYLYDFGFSRGRDYRYSYRQDEVISHENELVRHTRRTIDKYDGGRLRPDAKYFLLVNFHHLIILPILQRFKEIGRYPDFNRGELEQDITSDLASIISMTFERNKEAQLVSGHQIMATIDKSWKELRTTRLEVWG